MGVLRGDAREDTAAVSRPKDASGFVALPRRWVVERSLTWMMHARRQARDHERLIQY
ncbi:transposase [Streptomyces stelliscabiei]|uniref:Transposase n=1 Tax=Streptomyces stelliscabiei TaxID=146820 RepID=A0A8I0TV24_9ACTN|nr:transposase [Streptomyces stelliscabiei]